MKATIPATVTVPTVEVLEIAEIHFRSGDVEALGAIAVIFHETPIGERLGELWRAAKGGAI